MTDVEQIYRSVGIKMKCERCSKERLCVRSLVYGKMVCFRCWTKQL